MVVKHSDSSSSMSGSMPASSCLVHISCLVHRYISYTYSYFCIYISYTYSYISYTYSYFCLQKKIKDLAVGAKPLGQAN
jgi:hypothetical protein